MTISPEARETEFSGLWRAETSGCWRRARWAEWACHLLLDAVFLLGSLDLVNDLIYFLIAHIADKSIDDELCNLPLARYRRVDEYRLVAAFVR